MSVRVFRTRRVAARATIDLPLTPRQAWGQLRDFHRYAAHDHFHAAFVIDGGAPRAGAKLLILHRLGPFHTRRVGRITLWREGFGFAFSDLCERDPRQAFPHALKITVRDRRGGCTVTITVGGRWTAPLPRVVAWLWVTWVFTPIVQRVRNELLRFALKHAA